MHPATSLLRDLVSLPSINPMGRAVEGPQYFEYRVTDYLEAFFRSLGVRHERQAIAPKRDNIVAYYEPDGAAETLVFEAHQDTVPVEGMIIDPFGARIENGKLYGRGACDIKGGMAAMLAAFARLVAGRPARSARVVMACTVDEEFTFLGVQRLVQDKLGDGPVSAVVAEPTCLDVVNAHKGVCRWHLTTAGRACHSSRPELGVNAVYRMGRLIPLVERYAEELRASASHPVLGPPTLSLGTIQGGSSVNVVPDSCRIDLDRRLIPGEVPAHAPKQLDAYLRKHAPDVELVTSDLYLNCPSLSPDTSAELVARLGRAIDRVAGKHQVRAVPYGTDASTLALAGVPSVVFGPGDIDQAHTCDEWIDLTQLEQASEVLYRLATG